LQKGGSAKRGGISIKHCANLMWFDLVLSPYDFDRFMTAMPAQSLPPRRRGAGIQGPGGVVHLVEKEREQWQGNLSAKLRW
jgi:hypothetical protein